MKILCLFLSLFIAGGSAFAADLSSNDRAKLLSSFDQICADSWCAGDFNYQFTDLVCDFSKGSCNLDLSVKSYDDVAYNDKGVEIGRRSFPARRYLCELRGFSSTAELFDASSQQYSSELYDSLSTCIAEEIAPVQNAIRFAWPISTETKSWRLSRLVACPSFVEATRPIASEYAFASEDKSAFAAIAALDRSGLDAAANPGCTLRSFEMEKAQIRCVNAGAPAFCEVPVARGVYLVSKDYVDSTLVTFEANAKSPRVLPKALAKNDSAKLYLPDPAFCMNGLLNDHTQESSVEWSLTQFTVDIDLRFIASQLLRERVKSLSAALKDSSKCEYVQTEVLATAMSCEAFSKGQLCTLKSEQGGYWRIHLSENGRASTFFHRYD